MKIAIISDFHLGFGERKREKEALDNAKQAMSLALEQSSDAILLAGDLFDSSVPRQETLAEAFDLLSLAKKQPTSQLKITLQKSVQKEVSFTGVPVISIHGTHEFRGKDYTNVLDLYSKAGFLVYLHAAKAVFEKGSEKLVVHGLGGVPEKKALDVLNLWNPKPESDAKNILLLHQSFKEFLPVEDPMIASLSLDNLPKEFDLIVNGHLHWANRVKLGETVFLLPGSTIITQMKKLEAEKPKGIYLFDSQSNELSFFPLPEQRKLFYHKLEFKDASSEEIQEKVAELVESDLYQNPSPLAPLIRLKLSGSLRRGVSQTDVSFTELEQKLGGKAIFSISKDFYSLQFKKKIDELRRLQESKQSISSLGLEILEKNLKETDFMEAFDSRRIFSLLADNKLDEVIEVLSKKKS